MKQCLKSRPGFWENVYFLTSYVFQALSALSDHNFGGKCLTTMGTGTERRTDESL